MKVLIILLVLITTCPHLGKRGLGLLTREEGMELGQGVIVGFIHSSYRSSSCYSEDQGLQCYWRTGHWEHCDSKKG